MRAAAAFPHEWAGPRRIALPLVVVLLSLVLSLAHSRGPFNHDVSWYMVSTSRWLWDGAQLYRDIVEINPPLAFYETAALLLLFPAEPKLALTLGIAALASCSALWCLSLAERAGAPANCVLAAVLTATLIIPIPAFGQREHFLLVFALPYVVWMAWRPATGRGEAVALGVYAFLGFGLKPYFLAIPAFMSLMRAFQARSLRPLFGPANLTIGVLCLIYVAITYIAHPLYFEEIVPAARLVYFAYGEAPGLILRQPVFLFALPLVLVGLRSGGPAAALAAALAAAILIYLLQFKGWTYHLFPVAGLTVLLAATLLLRSTGKAEARLLTIGVPLAALLVALSPALRGSYRPAPVTTALAEAVTSGDKVLLLGENVWLSYPLIQEAGAVPTGRFPALWPLPGASIVAHDRNHPDRNSAIALLRRIRRAIADDFVRHRPDVLVVDERPYKTYYRGPFDYLAFLSAEPDFRRNMQGYRDEGAIRGFRIYRRVQ